MGDLVDQELNPRDRLRLKLHLLICRHCRRYLSSYRTTLKVAKDAYETAEGLDADAEMPDEQVAAILKAAGLK